MNGVSKFLLLPGARKTLLLESLLFVCLIRLGLWVLPFKSLNKLLASLNRFKAAPTTESHQPPDWIVVGEIVYSIRACSRFVPQATCLTQALAAKTLLESRGQDSHLKIGVRKDESKKLLAHAWLEIDKRIIIGKLPKHQRYVVLNSAGSIAV